MVRNQHESIALLRSKIQYRKICTNYAGRFFPSPVIPKLSTELKIARTQLSIWNFVAAHTKLYSVVNFAVARDASRRIRFLSNRAGDPHVFFFSGRNNTAASFFLFDKRYCFGITCNLVHRVSRWRQLRCEVLHRSVAERQNQNNTSRVRQSCDTLALHNLGSFACCHLRWLPYHGHAFADFDASGEVQKSPA